MRVRMLGILVAVALLTCGTALAQAAGDGGGIIGPLTADSPPDSRPIAIGAPPDGRPGAGSAGEVSLPDGRGGGNMVTDQPPAPPDTRLPGVQSGPPDSRGGGATGIPNWQQPPPR
jgi:hypothetical protein